MRVFRPPAGCRRHRPRVIVQGVTFHKRRLRCDPHASGSRWCVAPDFSPLQCQGSASHASVAFCGGGGRLSSVRGRLSLGTSRWNNSTNQSSPRLRRSATGARCQHGRGGADGGAALSRTGGAEADGMLGDLGAPGGHRRLQGETRLDRPRRFCRDLLPSPVLANGGLPALVPAGALNSASTLPGPLRPPVGIIAKGLP